MNLNKVYERNSFLQFLKRFVPGFSQDIREVQTQGFKVISQAAYLGECADLDLKVFEVVHSSSVDARVSLATDGFRLLKDSGSYRALVAYRPETGEDWRLSLLIATPEMTDKGGIGLEYSNPRRYSFYLGPSAKIKTPHQFLIAGGPVSDLDDLKSRFSVEVVNKEFYKLISKSFTSLVGGASVQAKKTAAIKPQLRLPSVPEGNQTSLEFAVRLIGRIIFCWFLREKKSPQGRPLMPHALLSRNAVRSNPDYYHKVLEPIFFEVLNRPLEERKAAYLLEPFSLIPYLNGGLFSPQAQDFYSVDEREQAVHQNTVLVPDNWFEDLFETLETYNFTIDENTSFDEELSIDPEILGRIFENLLAEINPETGESARKSTGSYYTPRAIVDYMVNESLVLYLQEKTGIAEDRLRQLVLYDWNDESGNWGQQEKVEVINALEELRLLDPACGSGAFPIGALQKIVFVLQQIDPSGKLWFERQVHNMSPELRRVIEREFSHQNFDYIRKLGIIRENIYGVDIQPIATEISRLRCFLTLIVEQHVNDTQSNRGVQPLPNLDFKFVTANSLIGLPLSGMQPEGLEQTDMFDNRKEINALKAIRDQYFNAFDAEREQLKDAFILAQRNLIEQVTREHGFLGAAKAELTRKLAEWEPFSHKANDWFDSDWMFGIANGFDIVIANPPYDVYQGERTKEIPAIKKLNIYSVARGGKLNAYKLFLARSTELLRENGVLCQIFQNSFLGDSSAKLLRKHFFVNQQILRIDSFPERDNVNRRVFEAVKMSVCILLSRAVQKDNYEFTLRVWERREMDRGFTTKFTKSEIAKFDPTSYQIPMLDPTSKKLFSTIYSNNLARVTTCYEGELNMTFHKKYFLNDPSRPKVTKGAAVQRYYLTDNLSQGSVEYLDIDQYLKDHSSSKKSLHHKYQRIVMQGITGVDDKRRLIMAILPKDHFCANSCNYLVPNHEGLDTYLLLGLLNSRLLNWLFKRTSTNSNVNCYEIEQLPLPNSERLKSVHSQNISDYVKEILKASWNRDTTKKNTTVKELDHLIDLEVYALYKLTEEDINLIEDYT